MNNRTAGATPDFDSLRAPADDGGVLIVPSLGAIMPVAERNRSMRHAAPVRLLGEAVERDSTGPLVVATGHQPEFMHPGVWAKNVAAARAAEMSGSRVEFLVVDSDTAADAVLRWPHERDGRLESTGRALPNLSSGGSFEQLGALPGAEWRRWISEIAPEYRADGSR